jgi:hypothetical protein
MTTIGSDRLWRVLAMRCGFTRRQLAFLIPFLGWPEEVRRYSAPIRSAIALRGLRTT